MDTKKSSVPAISVVIPTYREEKLIGETLAGLFSQTIIDKCEIIIVDYDPDGFGLIKKVVDKFNQVNKTDVRYMRADRPGIAYARHTGIMSSNGRVIVNFDADARFSKNDDIYQMIRPILVEKTALLTCCDNIFYSNSPIDPKDKEKVLDMKIANMLMEFLNKTQGAQPVYAFLEPGSTFDKNTYIEVGGFNDLKRWELTDLSSRMFYYYPFQKQRVSSVTVFVSPRRAINLRKYGLEILNYDLHFSDESPKIQT